MNTHIKIFITIISLFGIFSCQKEVKGPDQLPDENQLSQLDKKVVAIAKDLNLEAFSYAVVSNADVIYLKQNGVSPDEKIEVGDVKNMFLSTLFLQCTEEQLASPTDYLNQYGVSGDQGKTRIKNVLSFTDQPSIKPVHYSEKNFLSIYPIIEQVSDKEVADLFKSKIARKLDMSESSLEKNGDEINAYSSLNDLISFSRGIDNQYLFKDENTHKEMFRPVYLESGERSPAGLGCFIDISDARKLIWTAGETDGYSALMIKSETDSISFIMVAKSNRLNAPFNLEKGSVERSPLYYAFVENILQPDSLATNIDFEGDYEALNNAIQESIKQGKRDLAYGELVSYMRLTNYMKDSERYEKLSRIYGELFPKDIKPELLLEEPLAEIKAFTNYLNYKRAFNLSSDDTVTLFTTCEFSKNMTMNPWEYDNVEIYFDLNHEKSGFRSDRDDRQYRVDYDYPDLTGNAPTLEGIKFMQFDDSPTNYSFEIVFPWTVLFNSDSIKPEINKKIGFDIAIADNDGGSREGSLAWNSTLGQTPWSNTSFLGSMILADQAGTGADSICYALKSSREISLDGKNTGEWNQTPSYPIDNVFMEGITGPEDQSGTFQAQWDDNNLYILVKIRDDVKRIIETSGDFGWLVKNNQDTVWMQKEADAIHAGGALTNKYMMTKIPLTAGEYTLNYTTNSTHTFGLWERERPELSFYGIVAY